MFPNLRIPFTFLVLNLICFPFKAFGRENTPKIQVACDTAGFHVRFDFPKTFNGSIYSAGHFMSSLCSFSTPHRNRMTAFIPITACGTQVKETESSYVLFNTVVIQEHKILQTSSDIVQPITCLVPRTKKSEIFHENFPAEVAAHKDNGIETWMEVKFGADILGEQASDVQLGDDLSLAIHVRGADDRGRNADLNVRSCIAHDHEMIDESTSVVKVSNGYGCGSSDFISDFTVMKTSNANMIATAQFKAFKFPTTGQLYLTCTLQLCDDACPRTCDNSAEHLNTAVRRLVKRSAEASRSLNSRQYSERSRLMKETIKALASKLAKYTRLSRFEENSTAIGKRMLSSDSADEEGMADARTEVSDVDEFSDWEDSNEELTTLSFLNESPGEILSTLESFKVSSEDLVMDLETTPDSIVDKFATSAVKGFEISSSPSPLRDYIFNVTKNILVLSPADRSLDQALSFTNERDKDCVPRLRFSIIVGLLASLLFCSILICIVLTLHMRREKKKHLVENFLLYNFN